LSTIVYPNQQFPHSSLPHLPLSLSFYLYSHRRYHPDRNKDDPDAENKFREVAAAYETLSDAKQRRLYDQLGEKGMKDHAQGGGGGGGGGFGGGGGGFHHFQHGDPFNIFENVFGGGGGGGGGFRFNAGRGGGHHHHQQQQGGGGSLYADDALIGELDEDTFPENDGEGWVWIIEYYAPWCGHCRQLAPKYRKVAEALHGVVRVAAVNCDKEKALCQQHGIKGYPTIKGFKEGKLVEYRGDRSAAALRDWGLGMLPGMGVTKVSSVDKLNAWLNKDCGSTTSKAKWGTCILLLTKKSETSALYKSLALRYRGKLAFGEVREADSSGSEIAGLLGGVNNFPTLLAVCNGDINTTIPYDGEMKNTKLTKYLNQFFGGKKCAESIKIDSSTDFGRMRVGQLKELLHSKGEMCSDCLEKGDFIAKVRSVFNVEG
jgi:protein disulfide-isomerase-like protein